METQVRLCSFRLDGHLFGVDVASVQEVLRSPRVTRVPLSPRPVHGLIHLRGQIVTALDLRLSLGLEALPADLDAMCVVVRAGRGPVALMVDRVEDVLEVEAAARVAAPETLRGPARELIRGAYPLEDVLLLWLDTEKAVGRTVEPKELPR